MQNKMREQVNKATVLTMNDNTWYLNDQHYDAVVVKVLGKVDVAAAKENWPLYITVVGMVSDFAPVPAKAYLVKYWQGFSFMCLEVMLAMRWQSCR